jgi:hypothetical protein
MLLFGDCGMNKSSMLVEKSVQPICLPKDYFLGCDLCDCEVLPNKNGYE